MLNVTFSEQKSQLNITISFCLLQLIQILQIKKKQMMIERKRIFSKR